MIRFLDHRPLRRLVHRAALLTRGMTLGVRGIALDPQGRVCLVRHTYVRGWHLPGGGIERGETAREAMMREFREEAEIRVDPGVPLRLHGLFLNEIGGVRDHVAVLVAPAFSLGPPKRPDREIAQVDFFSLDAPPEGTTRGTLARLREVREGTPVSDRW